MALWQSLGHSGIPALMFTLAIYILLPALDRAGMPLFLNLLISLGGPLGLLVVASVQSTGGRGHRTGNGFRILRPEALEQSRAF
jgi:hypothetical protein